MKMEKHISKILWGILIAMLLAFGFAMLSSAQSLNPTVKSVRTDSIRARSAGGRIYFSNGTGSVVYLRTSGDSLYFGDVNGEMSLSDVNNFETFQADTIFLNDSTFITSHAVEGSFLFYFDDALVFELTRVSGHGFFGTTGEMRLAPISTATASEGTVYYDDEDSKFYGRDNDSWVEFGGGGGSAPDSDAVSYTADTFNILENTSSNAAIFKNSLDEFVWQFKDDENLGFELTEDTRVFMRSDAVYGLSVSRGTPDSICPMTNYFVTWADSSKFHGKIDFQDSAYFPYCDVYAGNTHLVWLSKNTALFADTAIYVAAFAIKMKKPGAIRRWLDRKNGEIAWYTEDVKGNVIKTYSFDGIDFRKKFAASDEIAVYHNFVHRIWLYILSAIIIILGINQVILFKRLKKCEKR